MELMKGITSFTNEGLELRVPPKVILYDALIPALEGVGSLFETDEYFYAGM
jgi:hypothetical protein